MIGDHDRTETEPFQEIRTIDRVFIRPDFVKRTFNNDIALIKLNRELDFSDHIRPVCLPKYCDIDVQQYSNYQEKTPLREPSTMFKCDFFT